MPASQFISVPLSPEPMLIYHNMDLAKSHRFYMPHGMATAVTYLWFYKMVRNHGPWDYKQQKRSYANFGNFNFGACGRAAGIPLTILLRAAGFAQEKAGTSSPEFSHWCLTNSLCLAAPYGDDPEDQTYIKQGYNFAVSKGY